MLRVRQGAGTGKLLTMQLTDDQRQLVVEEREWHRAQVKRLHLLAKYYRSTNRPGLATDPSAAAERSKLVAETLGIVLKATKAK